MDQAIQAKITAFFSSAKLTHHPMGTIIIHADEEPTHILQLESGIVEQYDITPDGNKVTVNVFKPPAFFPMSWAINRTPNSYYFAALTDITLRQAKPDAVVTFIKDNPDVLLNLLSRVYIGTDALLKRLALAASGVAANRLLYEMLIEAHRFGHELDVTNRIINVKQSVLAARCGLARETVSRELHKLEKEGKITLTKRGIILNVLLLEQQLDITV